MHKKLEEIAAALAELETAYVESPVGLAVLDTELRYRRVNARMAEMNGAQPAAHIGRTIAELVPSIGPLAKDLAREVLETGQPKLDVEFSGETPLHPGVVRYWREQWAPVKDARGKVIAISVAAEEITEQRRVALELEASRAELQRKLQDLETLMASVPAAVLVAHDGECRLVTGNREAYDLFRMKESEPMSADGFSAVRTRAFGKSDAAAPLSREELPMEVAAQTGKPVRNVELTLRCKDGTERDVTANAHPLLNEDGTVRGVIGAFTDITMRKRAEQRLEQEMRNKDTFLATLSHEMRTPLAALANGLEALALQTRNYPELQRVLPALGRQRKHLTRLVDDLLDLSRLGRGEISLQLTTFNLGDCVREVVDAMQEAPLSTKRQELYYIAPDDDAIVSADGTRIRQVLSNLIHNAHKFSPEGARIDVTLRRIGNEAVLTVADSGEGIPSEILPNIFDQFFTTGGIAGRQGGLGIGLWLSRQLVRLHGGTIEADNRHPSRGAEFTVRLPVVAS